MALSIRTAVSRLAPPHHPLVSPALFAFASGGGFPGRVTLRHVTSSDSGSGLGGHMIDNEAEAIKRAKYRQFKGRAEVVIPDVAGWSEDLASFSEAAVKADRYVGDVPVSQLQDVTLRALEQRQRNDEEDSRCEPSFASGPVKTYLGSTEGKTSLDAIKSRILSTMMSGTSSASSSSSARERSSRRSSCDNAYDYDTPAMRENLENTLKD